MKRFLVPLTILTAAFLLSPSASPGAASPIRDILVSPKGFISHLDPVSVRIRLNDTESSRLLILVMDCSTQMHESRIELGPKDQPAPREYKNLPPGLCTPTAILFWQEGEKVQEQLKRGPELYVMGLEPV